MSITTTTVGASPRTVKKQSGIVSLLLATLLALGSVLGVSTAASAAGETVTVATPIFRHGDFLTSTVGGLSPSTTYRVELRKGSSIHGTKVFTTNASGVPTDGIYQRIEVTTSVPIGKNYYVRLYPGSSGGSKLADSSKIEIKGPFVDSSSLGTATFNAATNKVTISGTGFVKSHASGASVIAIKLDNGAYTHPLASNPVPTPWPTEGASPASVWYYIGPGPLPNSTYGSTGINSSGNFTVTIPVPSSLASGNHTLRFLTGSLATGDAARAKVATFTK